MTSKQKQIKSDLELERRYCDCVLKLTREGKVRNPHAICTTSVGRVPGRRTHCSAHSSFLSKLTENELRALAQKKNLPKPSTMSINQLRKALLKGSRSQASREHALRKAKREHGISRGHLITSFRVRGELGKKPKGKVSMHLAPSYLRLNAGSLGICTLTSRKALHFNKEHLLMYIEPRKLVVKFDNIGEFRYAQRVLSSLIL